MTEGKAEDELHGGHARLGEKALDARGLPVPLAEARLLGQRADPPVLLPRCRATGRAAPDERPRALASRFGDELLVVALDGRVGDLEGVEDAHRQVVGQVREDARHADEPDLALVPQFLERLDRVIALQRGPVRRHVHLDEVR